MIDEEVVKHAEADFRRSVAAWMRTALFEMSPKVRWNERLRRAAGALKSFSLSIDQSGILTAGLDVDALEGVADRGDLTHDLTDLLVAVGEAAQSANRGLVLLFDEVQFLSREQLEGLIAALHKTVQRTLPVTMVAAGLPQIAELAGDAKSYAERLFKFPELGILEEPDARRALIAPAEEEGATWDDAALDRALEVTGRYPYFLQELGYAAWGLAEGPAITPQDVEDSLSPYDSKLDSSFFRVRLDRATELQRAYLRAMAELGPEPQKAADVAAVLDRTSSQVAPTRAELVALGLLYTPEHGYAAFTVPHFDKFMMRAMPELIVPAKRIRKS